MIIIRDKTLMVMGKSPYRLALWNQGDPTPPIITVDSHIGTVMSHTVT